MTAKEKAEQYVRGKCPELMELSFGCYVRVNVMGTWMGLIVDDCEVEKNGDEGVKIDSDCYEGDELEIIGHPPQLQHWLWSLGQNFSELETSVGRSISNKVFRVNLYGDKGCIYFNKYGQPATETDYQAFCEIVGV